MGLERLLGGTQAALFAYVVLMGLGLANCFFGYRLFKVVLGAWGFLGGVVIAMGVMQGSAIAPALKIAGAFLGGVVGALLVSVLYPLGVFLFGAGFGLLMAAVVQQHAATLPIWPLFLVLGVLGGVAALALQRPLISLFTAFGGAWVLVACSAALVLGCPLETFPAGCVRSSPWALAVLGAWLLLGLFGFATQARLTRGRPRRVDDEG